MLDLLFNPDEFFRQRADDPGMLPPLGILLLIGIIGAAGSVPALQATFAALPQEAQAFSFVGYISAGVGAIVGPFVRWLLFAGAFQIISAVLYDAETGSFRDTLALTGWGFVPAIFATIVSAVVAFVVFSGIAFPADPQQIQPFIRELRNRPEFLVASLLGIVFLLWSGFLWTFAVKHVRGLSQREAAITVGIPVAIALLWRLSQSFGVML
ncbi:Yip1 family protein [Halorarius litoreus]|uniref:Yip1 family protein n=1 Tax=Halorarius litoreus TaxID=2962676 RepID=UPI0020CD6018|nr:Yip1 family protein [Halorarius litoreus]